jgi:hypothetical protein
LFSNPRIGRIQHLGQAGIGAVVDVLFIAPQPRLAIFQPEDDRRGIRRIMPGRLSPEDGALVVEYLFLGVAVAQRPVIQRVGDVGVGKRLAFVDRLREIRVALGPLAQRGPRDTERFGQLFVRRAQPREFFRPRT